jgi:hypothetical protein
MEYSHYEIEQKRPIYNLFDIESIVNMKVKVNEVYKFVFQKETTKK